MNTLLEFATLSEKLEDLVDDRKSLANLKVELEKRNAAVAKELLRARNQGAFPFPLLLRAQKIQTEKSHLFSKFSENSNKQAELMKQMADAYLALFTERSVEGGSI
jgi:hypothetical protein